MKLLIVLSLLHNFFILGEEGYYFDYVEDNPSTKLFEGYVISEFLEKKLDSTKKNGVWTYFYKSGTIEREVFYLDDQSIKIYIRRVASASGGSFGLLQQFL